MPGQASTLCLRSLPPHSVSTFCLRALSPHSVSIARTLSTHSCLRTLSPRVLSPPLSFSFQSLSLSCVLAFLFLFRFVCLFFERTSFCLSVFLSPAISSSIGLSHFLLPISLHRIVDLSVRFSGMALFSSCIISHLADIA